MYVPIQNVQMLCIFDQPLPGNKFAPKLKAGEEYPLKGVFLDSAGNQHYDVGLPLEIGYVRSFATGEELPPNTHFCHPYRFVYAGNKKERSQDESVLHAEAEPGTRPLLLEGTEIARIK